MKSSSQYISVTTVDEGEEEGQDNAAILLSRDNSSLDSIDYETSLPIRMDYAAALAYFFGLIGSLVLLFGEYRNDLVRFNAWQSFFFFFPILTLQFFLSFFVARSTIVMISIGSMMFGVYLGYLAYQASASFQVFYLPLIGDLAINWTNTE